MNRIALCVNTRNPNVEWLDEMLFSTRGAFDEVIVYVDEATQRRPSKYPFARFVFDGQARPIHKAFNHVVKQTKCEWIVPFCDDDYFLHGLNGLCSAIRAGEYDQADVIHFQVELSTGGRWGKVGEFGADEIMRHNIFPHGCFIRKAFFDLVGGYKLDEWADWNLWLRLYKAGARFKYYDKPVYYFRVRSDGAQAKQEKQHGHDKLREMVKENI